MMTGLDKIIERILADAKERARVILEQAQSDCRRTAAEYAARADAICEEIAERAMREGEQLVVRARSAAAMTRRNILLAAKSEMLDEVFEAAREQICDTDYGKYRELLVALLSCALLEQSKGEQQALANGDEVEAVDAFEVLLSENDRARFGDSVIEGARRVTERRIGAERVARLRLSQECADIDGGLILRCGDVEINCSITVLLRDMRRVLEERISSMLFD